MQAGIRDIKVIELEGQGTRIWNSQELQSALTVNEGWQHFVATYWGRVTHASARYANIGSDNFLSPGRRQATVSTDDYYLLFIMKFK